MLIKYLKGKKKKKRTVGKKRNGVSVVGVRIIYKLKTRTVFYVRV